jgi:hypothetical protein
MAVDLDDLYKEDFKLKKLSAAQKSKFKKHRLKPFPIALAVILHFVTLSLFTIIYYGMQHGRLPKNNDKDFGAGKAIGFMFIPFFNLYWIFMFWMRLGDRLNLQYKLRGKRPKVEKGLLIATCVIVIIFSSLGYLIMHPITVGLVQSSINELARMK